MEFLLQNVITPCNIVKYTAGLRASFILYNLDTTPFQNYLQYFQKAAKLQIQTCPKVTINLDENILLRSVGACDTLDFPLIFKSLYFLAFFPFLQISNILQHEIKSFYPTRQLAIGDVIFSHNAATIIIKWSKICSTICPIQALQNMLLILPGEPNDPLFRIPRSHGLVPLMDSVARCHLQSVSQTLGLNPILKFHDFRRAVATWAFHHGVSMKNIMHHATWKSDAVWSYIPSIPVAKSTVSTTFQHHLTL